jgi:hypothetical protein
MEGYDAVISGDKLIVKGLIFYGFHGARPEERTLGQKFFVDVDAWMDLKPAGKSDNLSHTFDYTQIYRSVTIKLNSPLYYYHYFFINYYSHFILSLQSVHRKLFK